MCFVLCWHFFLSKSVNLNLKGIWEPGEPGMHLAVGLWRNSPALKRSPSISVFACLFWKIYVHRFKDGSICSKHLAIQWAHTSLPSLNAVRGRPWWVRPSDATWLRRCECLPALSVFLTRTAFSVRLFLDLYSKPPATGGSGTGMFWSSFLDEVSDADKLCGFHPLVHKFPQHHIRLQRSIRCPSGFDRQSAVNSQVPQIQTDA